jgi:ribosome-associated toxin RatA of RatAB toxin-antitoxin module
MRSIKRSAIVKQPAARMYELINDVESYPQFVPWCTHARVESRAEREIVATLGVRRGTWRAEFTTRNELEPDRRVHMQLVKGPFRFFEGEWLLTPIDEGGSRIELALRFASSNPLSAVLLEPLFEKTAADLMDAFVRRAGKAA